MSQREKNDAVLEAIYEQDVARLKKVLAKGGNAEVKRYGDPAIFYAAARSDSNIAMQMIETLIAAKADIHQVDSNGDNVLNHLVSENSNYLETLKKLVALGVDTAAENNYGLTPLMNALGRKSWQMADVLIDNGGAKVTRVKKGPTILMLAIENDAPIELVEKILKTDVDVNARSPKVSPALYAAVAKNNVALVNMLLARPGVNPDLADSSGNTPLMNAVSGQRGEMIDILLKAKASPDMMDGYGATPLITAVTNKSKLVAEKLLKGGATIDMTDKQGRTALTAVAAADNQPMVELLVKSGASIDLADSKEETALSYAAAKGNITMLKFLIASAEEKGVKLSFGKAFANAAERGNSRIIELLAAAGGDVNEPDREGRTPLMKAVGSDQIETLGTLIKAGAKAGAVDNAGLSAYDHAVSKSKGNAKIFLQRYRGDAPVKAQDESRPVSVAPAEDGYRFTRLNNYSLEVKEGDGISMIFNFWTQQVIFRDAERSVPMIVQSFTDIPRQDAIKEAYDKLKELGGTPPEPNVASLSKKQVTALSRP